MITLNQIIYGHNVNMSARPEFYSGRGATTSDLNSERLQQIYNALKVEATAQYGLERAKQALANFVQFVADMKYMSATNFLNQFYSFLLNDCEYTSPEPEGIEKDIAIGPDDGTREATAMTGLFGLLGGQTADQTESIRRSFLHNHRGEYEPKEPKKNKRYNHFGNPYYSNRYTG